MKTIVYFYSYKSSNRFLAHKIAKDLNCDIEELKPRPNNFFLLFIGLNFGNKKLSHSVENYERVILCGPIWMGKLIVPLKDFLKKHKSKINQLIFVASCGSTSENKDDKYGYNTVFKKVRALLGDTCKLFQAFSTSLVLPKDKKNDNKALMETHLNEENFKGEIEEVYGDFLIRVKELRA